MPDAVRRAVERTVQSTVGSAGLTRDRVQEIVDEVARRAEQGAARGQSVRESIRGGIRGAGHRQAEAAAAAGDRLRVAIPDLRVATRDDLRKLQGEIARLADRVERLERSAGPGRAKPTGAAPPGRKRSGGPARSPKR